MQSMTDSADFIRLDAATVKVLAHPLRSRLVGALRLNGPSTATALAQHLGTNSGATSYHLRKLAEVGLVVDTGQGDAKSRVWAAASEVTDDTVLVSADQLRQMHDELGAVIARYRRVGQGNPDAKRIATYLVFYPVDMDKAPRR